MPNKKINQLDARVGATLADLLLIGDPTTGTSYKLTATELSTLLNAVPYTGATANVNLGEFGISSGYFQSDLTPTGTQAVGRLIWNDTDGTLDLGLKGGNVTLQVGQEQVQRVVNKSGVNLLESAYQVVKVTDAQGQRLAVDLAQGNNDANSTDTLGIVTETINNNLEGFITTSGLVRNINTTGSLQGETWIDGDVLYLSPTIPGAITKVKPTAPNHSVILGYVVYAHINNGKIFVKCNNGYELGELHDLYVPTPSNNDGIFWNTANLRYQNNSISGILGYTPQAALTLTTTGSSGAATLTGATLNIPQYAAAMAIGGSITSATAGSVLFAGTSGVLAQDNANLFWDDTNDRLGIGTATPFGSLHLRKSLAELIIETSSGTGSANVSVSVNPTSGANAYFRQYGSSAAGTAWGLSLANSTLLFSNDSAYLLIGTLSAQNLVFGTANNERARLTAAGRLLLGTTTESTFLLDVNGTARVSNTFTVTKGASNYITLEASANGTSPFIDIFYSANSQARIYPSVARAVGNLTLSPGISINQNSTTIDAGLYASNIGILNGQLGITNSSGNSQIHLNTSSGFSTFISFRETAVADKGVIGFSNGGTYFQIRTNGATSLTTGTLSTIFDNVGSVGIGGITSVNTSAILQVDSTTKGFLPPRMTTTQKNAIGTPAAGLMVFDTTLVKLCVYSGTAWETITSI